MDPKSNSMRLRLCIGNTGGNCGGTVGRIKSKLHEVNDHISCDNDNTAILDTMQCITVVHKTRDVSNRVEYEYEFCKGGKGGSLP